MRLSLAIVLASFVALPAAAAPTPADRQLAWVIATLNGGTAPPTAELRRHFTPGELGPITVLLSANEDWKSPAGRAVVTHLSRGFGRLDNVAEVRSLTQPLGELVAAPTSTAEALFRKALNVAASAHYTADCPNGDGPRYVTRLDIVLRSDPFADASNATTPSFTMNVLMASAPRRRCRSVRSCRLPLIAASGRRRARRRWLRRAASSS